MSHSNPNPTTALPLPQDAELSSFYRQYKDHPFLQLNPLYAIPADLLRAISKRAPTLLCGDAWKFEIDFNRLCDARRSLGLVDHAFIQKSMVFSTSGPPLADADLRILAEITGRNTAQEMASLRHKVEIGIGRIDQMRLTDRPYIGWLITNPEYLEELAALRKVWDAGDRTSPTAKQEFVATFLRKWQLSRLTGWDLPSPQGPLPAELSSQTDGINISIPFTAGAKALDALQESIMDSQDYQAPPHLVEWINVVRRRGQKFGLRRYELIFNVRFYRDVVLARHAHGFPGNISPLDLAFGDFLGVSEDEIRKTRVSIKRRLSMKTDVHQPGS